jgi:hypothetical protein
MMIGGASRTAFSERKKYHGEFFKENRLWDLLGGRRRERDDVTAKRASILKCHMPQSADADDTEAGVPGYGVT